MRTSTIILIVLTAILAPIAVGITVWEIENQPLIDYRLESVDTLNTHYDSYISIDLMIRNRGKIDATLLLTLTVENATIQQVEGTNVEYNETKTSIRVFAQKEMENWGVGKTLKVIPENSTQTFSVNYEVSKEFDWMSIIYRINPILPTTLAFNQTQPNIYTLIS